MRKISLLKNDRHNRSIINGNSHVTIDVLTFRAQAVNLIIN